MEQALDLAKENQGQTLEPNDVVNYYRGIDTIPREDVQNMIRLYPKWSLKNLGQIEIVQLSWHLDKDPQHISHRLTEGGKKRSLYEVAKAYRSLKREDIEKWGDHEKIEDMVDSLKQGERLPPIIIIKGDRYPDSPNSSFIDGVHRSLATMLYLLDNPDPAYHMEAFVGQKDNIFTRALKKFR